MTQGKHSLPVMKKMSRKFIGYIDIQLDHKFADGLERCAKDGWTKQINCVSRYDKGIKLELPGQ